MNDKLKLKPKNLLTKYLVASLKSEDKIISEEDLTYIPFADDSREVKPVDTPTPL